MKINQLVLLFMQFDVQRLEGDEQGNVYVYLNDINKMSLARLINENELHKKQREKEWVSFRNKWYKPVMN